MSNLELLLIQQALNNIGLVQRYSLTELSENIGISKASILRFCQKTGFSGFNEFKFECKKYVNSIHNVSQGLEEQADTPISRVGKMYSDVLSLMERVLKEQDVKSLVKMMKESRRIRAFGIINSSLACMQLRYAFLMFEMEIDVINSEEELKTIDLSIQSEDLTIIFSASGKNDYIKKTIEYSKSSGAKVALITMNIESAWRKVVDVFITLPSISNLKSEPLLNSVPIFSVFIEILNVYFNS